jgi:hypothetical protein
MIKSGSLGEIATMKHFLAAGFEVYTAITDSSTYDMVIAKGGTLSRVEVKSTRCRNKANTGWIAQIRSIRSNKTTNRKIHFDKSKIDILAIYIEPLDRIVTIEARNISQRAAITLMDSGLSPQLEFLDTV